MKRKSTKRKARNLHLLVPAGTNLRERSMTLIATGLVHGGEAEGFAGARRVARLQLAGSSGSGAGRWRGRGDRESRRSARAAR